MEAGRAHGRRKAWLAGHAKIFSKKPRGTAYYRRTLAARLLGGDADRARVVVQDTFVKLMDQARGAVDGHAVEWLFTVCGHRTLDVRRKEGRMKRFEDGEVERVASVEVRPGRVLEHEETHAALLEMIGHLPTNQQGSCG